VKKEFKDHVGEMENMRNAASEKRRNSSNSMRWTTFEDDENCHPNLFNNVNDPMRSDPAYENPFWRPSTGLSMLK